MENTTQATEVQKPKSSIKLSLRYVREKFNVKDHLDSLATLKDNRAARKNMEKIYLEKIVKELHGQYGNKHGESFEPVEDSRQAQIIVFADGSQAKNDLFRETITHKIARQMGQV